MLSAALIYGMVVTIVAATLGWWLLHAEHDAESMRSELDRHRDDAKMANDRKWELIARNNEAVAQLQVAKREVAELVSCRKRLSEVILERDEANRQINTVKGYLETLQAEHDAAIREQAKWKEAAEYAVNNLREIDRMLTEHMQPADASNIPF